MNTLLGFLSLVAKGMEIDENLIKGKIIDNSSGLYKMIDDIFEKSKKECDIEIKFISDDGTQTNSVRDLLLNIINNGTIESCKSLVKRLSFLTDNKTKEGLLFILIKKGTDKNSIFIARFPVGIGITTDNSGPDNNIDFKILDDVFLKNSKKYKAAYFEGQSMTSDFWVGYAVDKQISDSSSKIREVSDYWIKDFLSAELTMTPKRGSKLLAKVMRKTLDSTSNEQTKTDILTSSNFIQNIENKSVSVRSVLNTLNFSNSTKEEILSNIEDDSIADLKFLFDSSEFNSNFNYLVRMIDNGAVIIAPAKDFNEIWIERKIEDDKYEYSTIGLPIKDKITNRV